MVGENTYCKSITLGMRKKDYEFMCKEAERLGITRNEWMRAKLFGSEPKGKGK